MTAKLKLQRETVHAVPVRVTEYLDHRMAIRKVLLAGTEDTTLTPVELSISGGSLLLMFGAFGGRGRQFSIALADLTEDVLTGLAKATNGNRESS